MKRKLISELVDRRDVGLAALAGIVLGGLAAYWSVRGLHPALWRPLCEALGFFPPDDLSPSLWRWLVWGISQWVPVHQLRTIIAGLGHVALGLMVFMMYFIVRELLPRILSVRMAKSAATRKVVRSLCLMGAVFIGVADPVWRAGQAFSPVTLHLLMLEFALWLYIRFLRTGHAGAVYVVSAICGIVAKDSFAGWVAMLLVCVGVGVKCLRQVRDGGNVFTRPWRLTHALARVQIVFMQAVMAMTILGFAGFARAGGLEVENMGVIDCLLHQLLGYWHALRDSASWCGWLFVFLVVVGPVLHAVLYFRRAFSDEKFLHVGIMVLYVVLIVCGLSQVSGCPALWFWTWIPGQIAIRDDVLLAVCLFVCVLTAIWGLGVVGVDVYFRNYRRIAQYRITDEDQANSEVQRVLAGLPTIAHLLRLGLRFMPYLLIVGALAFVRRPGVAKMVEVLDAYCREVVKECAGASLVVTDGYLDAGVELAAREAGCKLHTLSMMGMFGPLEVAIRRRAAEDEEEGDLLARGAVVALRDWVNYNSPRLQTVAVQLGLETWRQLRRQPPTCLGLVARCGSIESEEIKRSRDFAAELSRRVVSLYQQEPVDELEDNTLLQSFRFVQWRVARISRMLAEELEAKGDVEGSLKQTRQADELDSLNLTLNRLQRKTTRIADRKGRLLAAREGLQLGLARADFSLARGYAQQVLLSDPDDTAANFAMGMEHLQSENFAEAEIYLRKCLVRSPNEPAALNNLALAEIRMGHLEHAEAHARQALKLLPDSLEVQETLRSIEKLRAEPKR